MASNFFTNFECENSLKWQKLVDALEGAMMRFSTGGVQMPVRAMLSVEAYNGYLGLMPCYSSFDNVISCKIISLYSDNKKYDAPTIIVYVLMFDADTGKLISIMQGEGITKRRTAATSALSARWLANKTPRKLAVLGSGLQALSHIQVLLDMYPGIEEISIWNHRKSGAIALAGQVSGWQPSKTVKVFDDVEPCVADADLIVTATFATTPVLNAPWVKPGAHIMAVGAAVPNEAEMDPELLRNAQVFVDSYGGASKESGDIIMSGCEISAELGEVICNQKSGRANENSITVFKSLGLAVQDLIAGKLVLDDLNGQSIYPLPVPYWSEDEVNRAIDSITDFVDSDYVPPNVQSNLETSSVTMECKATSHNPKYLSCSLKTTAKDGSGGLSLTMVYRALTGQLLGVLEGDRVNQASEGQRGVLFAKLFPL